MSWRWRRPLRLFISVSLAQALSVVTFLANAQDLPTPEDILRELTPDAAAEGIFRSWKGVRRTPAEKAENTEIPNVQLYVTFEFASHELTDDGRRLLSQAGLALIDRTLKPYTFYIAGHTDSVGSNSANQLLSERRAQTVRNYLVDEFKIDADRLIVRGYGESQLLRPDDPEGDANRRVEIKNIGPSDS